MDFTNWVREMYLGSGFSWAVSSKPWLMTRTISWPGREFGCAEQSETGRIFNEAEWVGLVVARILVFHVASSLRSLTDLSSRLAKAAISLILLVVSRMEDFVDRAMAFEMWVTRSFIPTFDSIRE